MTPLAIDLFCGLGGWTEGLLAEGYRVIGFDIERHAYGDQAYPAQLVLQDVLTIHGAQFKSASLIVASPPCQEYSYMAMPWSIAKQKQREYEDGTRDKAQLTALFDACFRIQREASEAAGHHIPLVVENVRGAQRWVGRARWNFGSFYLWGDVPALMPIVLTRQEFMKVGDVGWRREEGQQSAAFTGTAVHQVRDGRKIPSGTAARTEKGRSAALGNYDQLRDHHERGVKGFTPSGEPLGKNTLGRKHGSRSKARKAASAMIAKIPITLSRHIAASWYPRAA